MSQMHRTFPLSRTLTPRGGLTSVPPAYSEAVPLSVDPHYPSTAWPPFNELLPPAAPGSYWNQWMGHYWLPPKEHQVHEATSLPARVVRQRRRGCEIERIYNCGHPGCDKAYGTLNHLNAHVAMQSHGAKRLPKGTFRYHNIEARPPRGALDLVALITRSRHCHFQVCFHRQLRDHTLTSILDQNSTRLERVRDSIENVYRDGCNRLTVSC